MAHNTTTVVIGAGHAGLAMSHWLSTRSIDHVLLERGEVANTWKTERWDSLRLLTPNWQSRLPGFRYDGDDPDGFMTMPEVISFIERYAAIVAAPVHTGTTVTELRPTSNGYAVTTDQGCWSAPTVVLATGACNVAHLPRFVDDVPAEIDVVTPDGVPQPGPTRRRWRAGGRSVGDGHPARRRDPPFGPPGDAGRGRPRARPAPLPGSRHPTLDGRRRHDGRAIRRGRRHRQGAPAPVVADRRHPHADHARSQRPDVHRRSSRRAIRWDQRGAGAVLGVVAQRVRAGRSQARPAARRVRRVGDRARARRRARARLPAGSHDRRGLTTVGASISLGATSARSSGPPAFAPTTPGWTRRCSIARA